MPELLEFNFRTDKRGCQHWAKPSWHGRWLRGIELNEQRLDGRFRKLQVAPDCSKHLDPHRDPSTRLLEAWKPVEDELRRAVDATTFRIQLASVHPHRIENGAWILACHSALRGWIADRFGRLIERCAGRPCEFVACEAMA